MATPYNPLRAYQESGVESRVDSATPHTLLMMLYDGAITAVARAAIQSNTLERGMAVTHAISILEAINAGLDREIGGVSARHLHRLHQRIIHRLLQANLRADTPRLDRMAKVLIHLKHRLS